MELLPEPLDPHSAETGGDWKSRAVEHSFWFLSRGLLIVFIVLIAFFAHVPFQKLLQRDAALEMEEAQKEKLLAKYKLIDQLSVGAVKFQAALETVFDALAQTASDTGGKKGDSVTTKLHRAEDGLNALRDLFEARQIPLDDEIQEATEHLINDGDDALSRCQAIASEIRLTTHGQGRTFKAEKEIVAIDIADINGYEHTYVSIESNNSNH